MKGPLRRAVFIIMGGVMTLSIVLPLLAPVAL